MDKLLACPFCGGKAHWPEPEVNVPYVGCTECGASAQDEVRWNTRAIEATRPTEQGLGWQSIDTAPKDRPILSTNRHGALAIIMWWPHAFLSDGRFTGAWDDGDRPDPDESIDGYIEYHPKLWQPLPEPPDATP